VRVILDLKIMLGPLGPEEDKKKVHAISQKKGQPVENVWVDVVHQLLKEYGLREPEGANSVLDQAVGKVFGLPLCVNGLYPSFSIFRRTRYPAVILYPHKITNSDGMPVAVAWENKELQSEIANTFGLLFKTEWVRLFACFGPYKRLRRFPKKGS
jgi:hypothetical protein